MTARDGGEPPTPAAVPVQPFGRMRCRSIPSTVLKVNASVRKLLSTIKAHLVSPARNREWTAYVAMPAAKEPLEDGLYSKFHNLLPWQFVLHFWAHAHVDLLG